MTARPMFFLPDDDLASPRRAAAADRPSLADAARRALQRLRGRRLDGGAPAGRSASARNATGASTSQADAPRSET